MVPLACGLPSRRALFLFVWRMRPLTRQRRRFGSGSPSCFPVCSWRARALPGFWVVLFAPAAIKDPASCSDHPRPGFFGGRCCCLQAERCPGLLELSFRGNASAACCFTRLRIAGVVTHAVSPATVARLASGSPGSALTGRDSHPRDDSPIFRLLTHVPLPSDQDLLVALFFLFVDVSGAGGESDQSNQHPGAHQGWRPRPIV